MNNETIQSVADDNYNVFQHVNNKFMKVEALS
jgi:hypothetical protein